MIVDRRDESSSKFNGHQAKKSDLSNLCELVLSLFQPSLEGKVLRVT